MKAFEFNGDIWNYLISGSCRDVYVKGSSVLKVLKPVRVRGFKQIPMAKYTRRFGIEDYNEFEFENYQRLLSSLDSSLHHNLVSMDGYGKLSCGCSYVVTQLLHDADGTISNTLKTHGSVSDSSFWDTLDLLVENLFDSKLFMFDLGPHNIGVRKNSEGTLEPVLFDYKRIGHRLYPGQPWLRAPTFSKKKVMRRVDGVKENYS